MEFWPIPKRVEDLTGQKFHRLTVQGIVGRHKNKHYLWRCICDCGNTKDTLASMLKRGQIHSCGCKQRENVTTHGMSSTPTYIVWRGMIVRCNNPKSERYCDYGGRGITVCDRWLNSFEAFLEDMGEKPEGLSLDRKDNSKGYDADNCRWATDVEQARNKRNNTLLEYDNRIQPASAWAEEKGIPYGTLLARLEKGWDVKRSLEEPIAKKGYQADEQYIVIDPSGNEFLVDKLGSFAKSMGVNVCILERLSRGDQLENKDGWQCRFAHETEEQRRERAKIRMAELAEYARQRRKLGGSKQKRGA